MRKILSCVLILSLVMSLVGAFAVSAASYTSGDYNYLRQRRLNQMLGANYNLDDPDVKGKISRMDASAKSLYESMIFCQDPNNDTRKYLWADYSLPYSADNNEHWSRVQRSFDRLIAIATAYKTLGSAYYNDLAVRQQIIRGLDVIATNYYNDNTPDSNNWWYRRIGAPLSMVNVMMLMKEDVSKTNMDRYLTTITKFNPTVGLGGTNTAWVAQVVAYAGILEENPDRLQNVKDKLKGLFTYVSSGEGYFLDGSYVFHGYVPYNGGYGCGMAQYLAGHINLFAGSPWEIKYSDGSEKMMEDIIFKALEPFIYKGSIMDMERGRGISRYSSTGKSEARWALSAASLLVGTMTPDVNERLEKWIKQFVLDDTDAINSLSMKDYLVVKGIRDDASITQRGELNGLHRFPSSDRVTMYRDSYATGLAMNSDRIYTYEAINGEALEAWHTGDGMLYIYNNDREQYNEDFWPTVDRHRLPGTTIARNLDLPQKYRANTLGKYSWVGGSDVLGQYGATGMRINNDVEAKKSWFFFDDEIVALGTGISNSQDFPVETIIENRKIKLDKSNELRVNDSVVADFDGIYNNVNSMHLQGNFKNTDIGYYFPQPSTITGKKETRTGLWTSMYNYVGAFMNTDPKTKSYATFFFDHGNNPTNASYGYVLLPGKTSAETATYSQNPNIEIIENSTNIHAVRENALNVTSINFWNDNNTTQTCAGVTVDQKASITIKETDEAYIIGVSDPTQNNTGKINVKLNNVVKSVVADKNISNIQTGTTLSFDVMTNAMGGRTSTITAYKTKDVGTGGITEELGTVLPFADDTYITNESGKTGLNYGAETTMQTALGGANALATRMSYMKMTLPTSFANETYTRAKLRLKVSSTNIDKTASSQPLVVYETPTNWDAQTLTWDTATTLNSAKTQIVSATIPATQRAGDWFDIDITDYVRGKQAGDTISLTMLPTASWAVSTYTTDATIETDRPHIKLLNPILKDVTIKTIDSVTQASIKADVVVPSLEIGSTYSIGDVEKNIFVNGQIYSYNSTKSAVNTTVIDGINELYVQYDPVTVTAYDKPVINTLKDVSPQMPTAVYVTLSNGNQLSLPVTWETGSYSNFGITTINGYVTGVPTAVVTADVAVIGGKIIASKDTYINPTQTNVGEASTNFTQKPTKGESEFMMIANGGSGTPTGFAGVITSGTNYGGTLGTDFTNWGSARNGLVQFTLASGTTANNISTANVNLVVYFQNNITTANGWLKLGLYETSTTWDETTIAGANSASVPMGTLVAHSTTKVTSAFIKDTFKTVSFDVKDYIKQSLINNPTKLDFAFRIASPIAGMYALTKEYQNGAYAPNMEITTENLASVTIKYLDENNNSLISDVVASATVGTEYTPQMVSEYLVKNNNIYLYDRENSSAKITVVDGNNQIIIKYKTAVITKQGEIKISTNQDVVPVLPSSVRLTFDTGFSALFPTVWQSLTSSDFAQSGDKTVTGTLTGTNITSTATVTVNEVLEAEIALTNREILADGDGYKIVFTARNKTGLPVTITTALAAYNNDRLLGLKKYNVEIPHGSVDLAVSVPFTAPATGVYQLKGFLWNGVDIMMPFSPTVYKVTTYTSNATHNGRINSRDDSITPDTTYTTYGLTVGASPDTAWRAPTSINGVSTVGTGGTNLGTASYHSILAFEIPANTEPANIVEAKVSVFVKELYQYATNSRMVMYSLPTLDWATAPTRTGLGATQTNANLGSIMAASSPITGTVGEEITFDVTEYLKANLTKSSLAQTISVRVALPQGAVRLHSMQSATGTSASKMPKITIITR